LTNWIERSLRATVPSSTREHIAKSARRRDAARIHLAPAKNVRARIGAMEINFHACKANAARATSGERDRSRDGAQLDARARPSRRAPMCPE
jgi:hypothetical protein